MWLIFQSYFSVAIFRLSTTKFTYKVKAGNIVGKLISTVYNKNMFKQLVKIYWQEKQLLTQIHQKQWLKKVLLDTVQVTFAKSEQVVLCCYQLNSFNGM